MAQEISRRNIAKGAAWSVPAIAIASPAVAAATSACTPEKKRIIDEAFNCICLMAYWTEPSWGLANGCDKVPSFNVINLSRYEVNASVKNPLKIHFEAIRTSRSGYVPNGPAKPTTSWGYIDNYTRNVDVYTGDMGNQKGISWNWTFNQVQGGHAGTPIRSAEWAVDRDNQADFSFSTGITEGGGIIVQATLMSLPKVTIKRESIEEIHHIDLKRCEEYIKIKNETATVKMIYGGPLLSSSTGVLWKTNGHSYTIPGGTHSWNVGESWWSCSVGNWVSDTLPPRGSRGYQSTDGRF